MNIQTIVETARGCGYRKKGGLYFVTTGRGQACGRLPIELNVCPCCGSGVKFSRGFTWITPALFGETECQAETFREDLCFTCPLSEINTSAKLGLMWVGEKFYTPDEFTTEAINKGISKRIASVPNGFKVGFTWIMLAHIKAIDNARPGIFYAFKPSRIEYVITGKETVEQLEALEKRGITLVNVIRDIDQQTAINFDNEKNTDHE